MNTPPHSKTQPQSGFTLIEVTLAVGIAAVALVSLMAMIPQGLLALKRATDQAVEARIHQQIISEISLATWKDRDEYDDTVRYYDDQGIEVEKKDHSMDPMRYPIIYAARILIPDESASLPKRIGGRNYQHIDAFQQNTSTGISDEDVLQLVIVEVSSSRGQVPGRVQPLIKRIIGLTYTPTRQA